MRLARSAGLVAVLGACLLIPAAATGFNGTVLRGFGTATIDGAMSGGEWDPAGRVDFTVNRSSSQGGGTVPATLYVMNDATTLYVGIRVTNATVATSTAEVLFDNDHDENTLEEGSDDIYVDGFGDVYDGFVHQVSPNTWQLVDDLDYGGTHDVAEADADHSGYSFYEFSHALDSADNAHDFSLRSPMRVGFLVRFRSCSPCAPTSYYPSLNSMSEILILSGSRVAPDTQLTAGPADGSMLDDWAAEFQFTGSDDVVQPPELTFECKTDEDSWRACTSPYQLSSQDDGRHTFSVRAIDEMLNVDQSPAQRTWSVDTTGPSKPVIRGPRSARKGKRVVLRFSSTDEVAGGVRFKCAVDSTRLKRCPAVFRVKLRPGRRVIRVRALDRLGNQSGLSTFRIRVKRTRR